MEEFFYSKASRETFLMEDGVYKGVAHGEYVYMAIPLERTIDMDTLALYMQATNDVAVYIDVYITAVIPPVLDEEGAPFVPDSTAGVGEIVVHLAANKWNSFSLDNFTVNGVPQKSTQVEKGQYILLHFKNNSGIAPSDEKSEGDSDSEADISLPSAEITMTNLLIRALDVEGASDAQGGE